MNKFVLVEFISEGSTDQGILCDKLNNLGDDYIPISSRPDWETGTIYNRPVYRYFGRISSVYASLIKLQDPFLAERMKISYITEDLKNKYRK
jgi:hypothetical protein